MEITLGDISLLKYKHNCESLPSITQGQILADPGATLREPPPLQTNVWKGGGQMKQKPRKHIYNIQSLFSLYNVQPIFSPLTYRNIPPISALRVPGPFGPPWIH